MSYSTRIIESIDELKKFESEWLNFISNPVTGNNLSNDPRKIRYFAERNPAVALKVLILEKDGKIDCIAPLYTQPVKFQLTLSVLKIWAFKKRYLKIFGSDIIRREGSDEFEIYSQVFDTLQDNKFNYDAIYAHHINCATFFWKFCTSEYFTKSKFVLINANLEVRQSFLIRFEGDYDSYLSSLGKKSRQNLQRTTRKLFRENEAKLVKYSQPEQVPEFLDCLNEVYKNCWQAKTFGYKARNTPEQIVYHTELAQEGWLRSYVLFIGDRPVAFEHTLQYEKHCAFQECGYDQEFHKLGVGSIVIHLAIEDMYNIDKPDSGDFGIGDAAYKRTFGHDQVEIVALFAFLPSMGNVPFLLQKAIHALEHQLRRIISYFKIENTIRKLLKHKA